MLKRLIALILVLGLLAAGCAGKEDSWQEYFDLGVRYLSEGNYEEAILAFSAAIDIDPKLAEAYEKRGDAYCMAAHDTDNAEKAAKYLEKALRDYEEALDLTDGDMDDLEEKIEELAELISPVSDHDIPEIAIPETTAPPEETMPFYIGYEVEYEYFTDYAEEYCVLTCTDMLGNVAWTHESDRYQCAQLVRVSYVGTFEDRCYYVEGGALVALDLRTGEELWRNTDFYGSPAGADAVYIDEYGFICLTGFFGPDFMVVDPQGNTVKYFNNLHEDYYWAFQLERVGDQIIVHLSGGPEGDIGAPGYLVYVDIDWHPNTGEEDAPQAVG